MIYFLVLLLIALSIQQVTWENCVSPSNVTITSVTIPYTPTVGQLAEIQFQGTNSVNITSSIAIGDLYSNSTGQLIQKEYRDTCKVISESCACPCSSASISGTFPIRLYPTLSAGNVHMTVSSGDMVSGGDYFCFTVSFAIAQ